MHDSDWSGEYYFLDTPVHGVKPKERAELHKRHIGFVFQSYHLLDNLTRQGPSWNRSPSLVPHPCSSDLRPVAEGPVEREVISIKKACELVGVSRRTINSWLSSGKRSGG
jgi:hypothetical protein